MSIDTALAFSLLWEGGSKFTDDPDDPGGATKYGIAKRSHPNEDIKALTLARATEIYDKEYWSQVSDARPEPLATAAFDTAVNVGVSRVKKWLAQLEGHDPVTAAKALLDRREEHYRLIILKNPKLEKYRKGWANRVAALRKHLGLGIP